MIVCMYDADYCMSLSCFSTPSSCSMQFLDLVYSGRSGVGRHLGVGGSDILSFKFNTQKVNK